MLTLLSFIFLIVIVVAVHEYGHYLAARLCGVFVIRFSVGFGKPILQYRDRRGTEWALAPIPLGGYVRMLDKDTAKEIGMSQALSLEGKSPPQRIFIYLAGPLANIVLSFALLLVLYSAGQQGLSPRLDYVRPHSAAAQAGLAAGSDLTQVNEREVLLWRHAELAFIDAIVAGEPIVLQDAGGARYTIPGGRIALDDVERVGGAAAAVGAYPYEDYIKTELAGVVPDSPAAQAGIAEGDTILLMGDVLIESWRDIGYAVSQHGRQPLPIVLWRESEAAALTVTVQPTVHPDSDRRHYIGVVPRADRDELAAQLVTIAHSLPELVAVAATQVMYDMRRAVVFLWRLIGGHVERRHVSGPLGIAEQSGEAAALGLRAWLRLIVLISTSLAILNLLPLPLLDGGQIVLSALQWVRKREFSERAMQLWTVSGGLLIMTIIIFVLVNDIIRFLF